MKSKMAEKKREIPGKFNGLKRNRCWKETRLRRLNRKSIMNKVQPEGRMFVSNF